MKSPRRIQLNLIFIQGGAPTAHEVSLEKMDLAPRARFEIATVRLKPMRAKI